MLQLTAGAIDDINSGNEVKEPILKILGHKNVPGGSSGQNRYRLLLSDGIKTHSFAMLATQLNHLIEQEKLTMNTVVKVRKYVCNNVQNNKCVLIILDLDILGTDTSPEIHPAEQKVDRQPLASTQISGQSAVLRTGATGHTSPTSRVVRESPQTPPRTATGPRLDARPNTPGTPGDGNGAIGRVFPIQSLNPYQNRWTIRARVSQKSAVRTWSNARGEGKLFNFTMTDESGEIKVTGFRNEVDKFFDLIQLNGVYYLSKAMLKTANKQFNSTQNEYEMTLQSDSVIVACEDEDANTLPQTHFNFILIGSLDQRQPNDFVDIVGVVHEVADIQQIVTKTTQRELKKRDVSLVDTSGCLVRLTLWGGEAETFDGSNHPVLVVKAAKISDFGGRSLTTTNNTSLMISPTNIPEAIRLKGWYDHEGSSQKFEQFRGETGGGGDGMGGQWKLLNQMKDGSVCSGDKPEYFNCKATVIHMKKENCMYQACPTDNCNKKVIDLGNGLYRCEKCDKETPNYKWRLMLQLNVADMCDNQWISAFQDCAEIILQKSADDIGALKEQQNDSEIDNIFQDANFNSYIFRMRAKMDNYNDENRLRVVVVDAKPVNYKSYNRRLIDNIEQLARELPAL